MMVTYDAYLRYPALSTAASQSVAELGRQYGITVEQFSGWLEFAYSGRDFERHLVGFLKALAQVLHTAQGEIECVVDEKDDNDRVFEFYTIADGKLFCEVGKIVRSDRKLVE